MGGRVAGALLLSVLLVGLPAGLAHTGPPVETGATRVAQDCRDDHGWHANRPDQLAHDLVALDAAETTDDSGTPVLALTLVMSTRHDPATTEDPRIGERTLIETVTFETPRRHVALTLTSTSDTAQALTVSGLDPVYVTVEHPIEHPGPDDELDQGRFSVELGLSYSDLRIAAGEELSGWSVTSSFVDPFGRIQLGDVLYGGHHLGLTGTYVPGCELLGGDGVLLAPTPYMVQASPHVPTTGPVADFAPDDRYPARGEEITFQDHSQDGGDPLVAWSWELGDGNTSTAPSPTHIYEQAGTYTVTLTVEDAAGGTDQLTRTIEVHNALLYVRDEGCIGNMHCNDERVILDTR